MPNETQLAVYWALQQMFETPYGTLIVTRDTRDELVGKTRRYFNTNNIAYDTFSYDVLLQYLG
jgi:predicted class III extradiol MEMO1 family dioxygenase